MGPTGPMMTTTWRTLKMLSEGSWMIVDYSGAAVAGPYDDPYEAYAKASALDSVGRYRIRPLGG